MTPEKTVWAVLVTFSVFVNVPASVPVSLSEVAPAKVRLLLPVIVRELLLKTTALLNAAAR